VLGVSELFPLHENIREIFQRLPYGLEIRGLINVHDIGHIFEFRIVEDQRKRQYSSHRGPIGSRPPVGGIFDAPFQTQGFSVVETGVDRRDGEQVFPVVWRVGYFLASGGKLGTSFDFRVVLPYTPLQIACVSIVCAIESVVDDVAIVIIICFISQIGNHKRCPGIYNLGKDNSLYVHRCKTKRDQNPKQHKEIWVFNLY